mmetsp:Transcript_20885/g.49678  ORF Transcript_20885/g.49678 Transcript_20885/m.49678 type:complete len:302 (-) Transcript_20885:815-1720(-)
MGGHAHGALEGLVEDLGEGGVGVHHHRQLLDGGAGSDGVGALLDEVRGVDADDVHAQHLAGVLVEDALGHARALELGEGLGVGAEAASALAEREALGRRLGLGLLLREPNHGDLGVGEASRGDGVVINLVLPADDVLDGGDSLGGRRVREHHLAVGITDAPQTLHHLAVRLVEHLHLLVDLDEAADGLDALVLKLEGLRVGDAAGADEGSVDEERRVRDLLLGLGVDELDLHGLLSGLARDDLGSENRGVAVNLAGLNQRAVSHAADLGVKGRHEGVHSLDEGDLRAECRVHVRELEADVA